MKTGTSDELLFALKLLQKMETDSKRATRARDMVLKDLKSLIHSMKEGTRSILRAEVDFVDGGHIAISQHGFLKELHVKEARPYPATLDRPISRQRTDNSDSKKGLDALRRLTYVSKASDDCSETTIAQITAKAAKKNGTLGVTGGLAFSGGHFFQCIEGPHQSIDKLMTSIMTDPRHHDLQILFDDVVPRRLFTRWDMADGNHELGDQINRLLAKLVPSTGLQAQLRASERLVRKMQDL